MAEIPIERVGEETFEYGRMTPQHWSENSDSNDGEPRTRSCCVRFCHFFKTSCSRCCAFSYKNSSQLNAALCFTIIFLTGILKVVFGSVSLSNGQIAIILAKQDNLHWCGVFLVSPFRNLGLLAAMVSEMSLS